MDLSRRERLPGETSGRTAAVASKYVALLSERAELSSAADVLARAFRDNPLNTAVIQGGPEKRYRSSRVGMRALLEVSLGEARILTLREASRRDPDQEAPAGVLIGAAPYGYPLPGPTFMGHLRCLLGQGPRAMGRWGRVYRELEAQHPLEPHWYLAVLGIAPEHQHRGNGAALLRAFVDKVDADGEPSYLETDRQENIAFYGKEGYEVVREVSVLGVSLWCMWRPAVARPSSDHGSDHEPDRESQATQKT